MLTHEAIDQHIATIATGLKNEADEAEHAVIDAVMAVAGSTLKAMHALAEHLSVLAGPPAASDSGLVP